MSIPKLPTNFRNDGIALITRMVRTKDLDDLQEDSSPSGRFDPHHQTKLKVCDFILFINIYIMEYHYLFTLCSLTKTEIEQIADYKNCRLTTLYMI